MKKWRLARSSPRQLLVDLGHFESRERAQRSILAGQVLVNQRVSDKPGLLVLAEAPIRVAERERYVSRGISSWKPLWIFSRSIRRDGVVLMSVRPPAALRIVCFNEEPPMWSRLMSVTTN